MKALQRLSAFLLVLVVLLLTLPVAVPTVAAAEPQDGPPPFTDYYCREALKALPNATALLYAYDQMVAGVEMSLAEITVYNGVNPISYEELEIAMDAYRRDHAEHFWLGSTFSVSYDSTTVHRVIPNYLLSGDALTNAKIQFEEAIARILADLPQTTSEWDRELAIHDALAARVTYVEGTHAHDAYGALVLGEAVCEGYAEALQVLYHRVGLQSLLVLGESINPSSGAPEGHAWNMVRINGKYYHVDLTWNDQGSTLYHAYFNLTDARIREDHAIDATAYALPQCNDENAHYFAVADKTVSAYSVDSIATLLKNNDLSTSLYLTADKATFLSWFQTNIRAIATAAGVSGSFTYGYSSLGREIVLTIDVCKHTALTPVSATPATCTEDGNVAYYVCTCGKWFSNAQATEEIRTQSSVRIAAKGHDWNERITDTEHLRAGAADCREADTYWYDCSNCNTISTNAYFATEDYGPHDFATEWSSDESGHFHTCRNCTESIDRAPHTPGEPPTHTLPESCPVCGYVLTPPLGHDHSTQENAHTHTHNDALPFSTDQLILYAAIGGGGVLVLVLLITIIKKCR